MQAPHSPVPHPNLVPVSLRPSRITHKSGVAGGASLDAGLPFTVKLMAMISSLKRKQESAELRQHGFHPRRMERQVADAPAGGMRERIGNRRDRGSLRAFARSERALGRTIDQLDLDLRRFRHGEDRVARPVLAEDA